MRFVAVLFATLSCSGSALAFTVSDASVTVSGGSLKVIGGPGAESVIIDQIGLTDPHEFRVTPGPSTTINGSASAQTFNGVKRDVVIEAGGSPSDGYHLLNAVLPRDVVVRGGPSGSLAFSMVSCTVKRDVRVDANGQPVNANLNETIVHGDFRVRGSDAVGGDIAGLYSQSIVDGDVLFDPRDGSDGLVISYSQVHGRCTMRGSSGEDGATIDSSIVDGPVRFADHDGNATPAIVNSTIGALTMEGANGFEDFLVTQSIVRGPARFKFGVGTIELSLLGMQFEKSVRITGGAAGDNINFGSGTTFLDDVSVALGAGDDQFAATGFSCARDLRIDTAGDDDVIGLSQGHVGGDLGIALGTATAGQKNSVALDMVRVSGDLRVEGGPAVDQLGFTHAIVLGELRASLGGRADLFGVDASEFAALHLELGTGDDALTFESADHVDRDAFVDAGSGNNTISWVDGAIGRDLRVRAGGGNDSLSLMSTQIAGQRHIDLGGGANSGP